MTHTPVNSSNLVSIGYDEDSETLEVKFKSDETYQYAQVKPHVHKELMEAESIGRYFHKNIRGQYPTKKA